MSNCKGFEIKAGGFRLVYSGGHSFEVYQGDRHLTRRPVATEARSEMLLYADALRLAVEHPQQNTRAEQVTGGPS